MSEHRQVFEDNIQSTTGDGTNVQAPCLPSSLRLTLSEARGTNGKEHPEVQRGPESFGFPMFLLATDGNVVARPGLVRGQWGSHWDLGLTQGFSAWIPSLHGEHSVAGVQGLQWKLGAQTLQTFAFSYVFSMGEDIAPQE